MKKLLSILMSAVMVATCFSAIPASAAVCYDKDNPDISTSTHTILNISGTDNNKAAFDFMNQLNTVRTANGLDSFVMDQELMEAAMLRARELYVYPDITYRPNGERFDYIVDFSGMFINYTITNVQTKLDAVAMANACTASAEQLKAVEMPEYVSVGVGCFKGDNDYYYWVAFFSTMDAINPVKVSDYDKTTSKTVKIAVDNNLKKEYWDKVHTHTYKTSSTTKADATNKKNGKITKKCSVCGKTSTTTIYYPKTITLSKTSYTYDGKAKKPTVTVKDSNGKTVGSQYYKVSYSNNTKVGKATVKVTFSGNYTGSKSVTFKINPKGTSMSSVTAGSKSFTAKWKKQATQTTGYQIQYATDTKFTKNCKTVTISKNSTLSKKVTKLSGKKKYYVRVRTYKTVSGTKYCSGWSGYKTVTTKK